MPSLKIKRGTRAQVTAAAAASQLQQSELYHVTDEGRIELGTAATTSVAIATKSEVDSKQATLVSGTNIKTVNGSSLLGAGNLSVGTSLPIENSAGTAQFTSTDSTGLQFAASGGTSVAFDAVNYRVTFSSTDTTNASNISSGTLASARLPVATSTAAGAVELFSDVVQSTAANAVTTTASRTYGIQLNASGQAVVNVPWADTNWYPTAFAWADGTTAGPTGSLSGTGMTAVSFAAIPSATATASGIVTTAAQTFAGDKTFSRTASTQDSIVIQGRAAGTSSRRGTLTIAALTGNWTYTLPNAGGDIVLDSATQTLTNKTYNGLTLTAAATGFTIAGGTTSKTLTVNNTLALSGTDSSTLNIGAGGTLGSAAFTASTAYEPAITTLSVAKGGTGATTLTGIVKGNGTGAFTSATAGTDYVAPGTTTTFTAVQNFAASGITLKGSSTGTTTFASANASATNYTITFPASTGTVLTTATAVTVAQGGTGGTTAATARTNLGIANFVDSNAAGTKIFSGSGTGDATGQLTITFPSAFTTLSSIGISGSSTSGINVIIVSLTTSGAVLQGQTATTGAGSNGAPIRWIAVGV